MLLGGAGSDGNGPTPAPSDSVLPAVSVAAPADTAAATVSTCARVISALPLQLAGLDLRRTASNPPSASIVAWGDPAVVLRCGVDRPAQLGPSLSAELFYANGVLMLPKKTSSTTVFTVIDRAVYLDISVPRSYPQPPLGPLATAIAKVLKPVCVQGNPRTPRAKLCTRRK